MGTEDVSKKAVLSLARWHQHWKGQTLPKHLLRLSQIIDTCTPDVVQRVTPAAWMDLREYLAAVLNERDSETLLGADFMPALLSLALDGLEEALPVDDLLFAPMSHPLFVQFRDIATIAARPCPVLDREERKDIHARLRRLFEGGRIDPHAMQPLAALLEHAEQTAVKLPKRPHRPTLRFLAKEVRPLPKPPPRSHRAKPPRVEPKDDSGAHGLELETVPPLAHPDVLRWYTPSIVPAPPKTGVAALTALGARRKPLADS